jgi:alkanesulfonate monooxygenase SsuD/methylene tetrahydromethanopterin reductase-like flavin-dependent oxidoreductase (luciferase family)
MGIGKPLKSILHMNPNIPIWLGTGTESNVKLTAELADGWFPLAFVPGMMDFYRPWLEAGVKKAGSGKTVADLEIQPGVSVVVTDGEGDEIQSALNRMKPGIALYAGGMGHRDKNFHNDMMVRRGFPEAAAKIQELYLAGRKREAIAAVPDEFCDAQALIGPPQRIRERYKAWEDSGATGLTLSCRRTEGLELMAELTGSRDRVA